METRDLNLLTALDSLLAEGGVTAAARRLGLSPSAMSRTLARLRAATGDPLLVRAGRGLVPTPRAQLLRERVRALTEEVHLVLSPEPGRVDPAALTRTFTIRAGEGFVQRFSPAIVNAVRAAAPNVRLCFTPKPAKTAAPLREGLIDLDIGVVGEFAPEVKTRLIFRDRFVGAARAGHPLLSGPITPERYAAWDHVVASRRGGFTGPVDDALASMGLSRIVRVVVPGFADALGIARWSDLIALVPASCLRMETDAVAGLTVFDLPVRTPDIAVSALWHPRMEADPVHRWLRGLVIAACQAPATAVGLNPVAE